MVSLTASFLFFFLLGNEPPEDRTEVDRRAARNEFHILRFVLDFRFDDEVVELTLAQRFQKIVFEHLARGLSPFVLFELGNELDHFLFGNLRRFFGDFRRLFVFDKAERTLH